MITRARARLAERGPEIDARLKLTNKLSIVGPVADFTFKWGLNAGLHPKDATRLALAVNELVTNIIRYAFRDESGEFDVTFQRAASALEVIVHELGEPFDPERHPYDPRRAVEEGDFEGAGLQLIKRMADDFIFVNKGRAGKEFRIVKQISSEHIAEVLPADDVAADDQPVAVSDYDLQVATKHDAEDIARLIYKTYGHTYAREELYFPKKIEMALERKEKFGVVVRDASRELVGYFVVLKSMDSRVGEVGEAVVAVNHRRRGIMTMMLNALIGVARERGLLGLYGEAVTVHTFSQQVNCKFGFHTTALLLADFGSVRYKGVVEEYPQPISVVMDFLPLVPLPRRRLYLPPRYNAILKHIYHRLGTKVEDRRAGKMKLKRKTKLRLDIDYTYRRALILIDDYGADFEETINQLIESLQSKDILTAYIDLPLDDPATKRMVDVLRRSGFVFCGLMPLFHYQRDYLRMQTTTAELDLDFVYVYSNIGRKIKQKIKRETEWTTKHPVTS